MSYQDSKNEVEAARKRVMESGEDWRLYQSLSLKFQFEMVAALDQIAYSYREMLKLQQARQGAAGAARPPAKRAAQK